jgi:hypothetical protein
MEAFNQPGRPGRPSSPHPDSSHQEAPLRVSTDPQRSKRSHLHGLSHPHRHHHHRSRQAKDVVQSAVQLHPPTSFGDLLKQTGRVSRSTPTPSESNSRRASAVPEGALDVGPRKALRPEDVAEERQKVKVREE